MCGPVPTNAIMKIKWVDLLDSPVHVYGGLAFSSELACDCTFMHVKSFVFENARKR